MIKKLTAHDIAMMGISVAILFVIGYLVYFITQPLLLPGAKFIFMAPLLSFSHYIPLYKRRKASTILFINICFGLLLFMMSPLMSVAIVVTGTLSALVLSLSNRLTSIENAMVIALTAYPPIALFVSFYISFYITGLNLYGDGISAALMIVLMICTLLAYFGIYLGKLLLKRTRL